MDSTFGNVFLFLTELAWKSRLTIPVLVTTAFLVMDIRLQIEINIQSGQVNASDIDDLDDGYEEQMNDQGADALDDNSEIFSDDLDDYNSEFTNGDGNSSEASRYTLDNYDDLGSEFDVDDEADGFYNGDMQF